jgi:hypothetical protein
LYNSLEQNNIEEIDKILNIDNDYVSIEPGSSKILQFITAKKMEVVEKKFKDKPFTQIRFIVIEPALLRNSPFLTHLANLF